MPENQVSLAVAAFLDSPRSSALDVPTEAVRKIARRFLTCCYDDVAKAPKHLDGHDLHEIVGHVLPGTFARKDPLAEHVPAVLSAYLAHLEETETLTNAFELKQALDGTLDEFRHAVRTGQVAHHGHKPDKPFVHQADKTGRNDPCPCGSGKKYKKCHGKAG